MLTVDALEAGYGRGRVLLGLSLAALPGQVISLIGRNGMGKTTTVRAVMGMIPRTGGAITFDGKLVGPLERFAFGFTHSLSF